MFSEKKKLYISISAFAIPAAIMLVVYFFMGMYPFGNNTLLTVDLKDQYISFFSYLKQLFSSGGGSPFYTFSKNLGGDMIGLGAYYLMSPLNLIFLLFDISKFPTAVLLLTLIKIGLSGFTMSLFLNRKETNAETLMFSTAYALMSYNIAYQQNIMWLDGIILLPVVIWGIEKIAEGKPPYLYVFSVAASIIINYYIGFMICIFSAIYFTCRFLFFRGDSHISLRDKKSLKPVACFGVSSVLAGGLSGFVLLPTLHSLQSGKASFSLSALTLDGNFRFLDLFSKLVMGSYDRRQMISGLPNIYCGMFVIAFCILFFMSDKVRVREKLGFGIMLIAVAASFYVDALNLIWHGLNSPAWFPYRYSFAFSFLLILCAYTGYRKLSKDMPIGKVILVFLTISALFMFIERIEYGFLSVRKIYLSIAITALTLAMFALRFRKLGQTRWLNSKLICITAACICFVDLGANAYLTLHWMNYENYDSYASFVQVNQPIVSQIKEDDSSFFRMEKTYRYSNNDAMMLNYNGLSHYSSSEKAFVKSFMGKMGFRNNGNWAYYNQGSTISVDSLLGVKYLLTKNATAKPYDLLWERDGVSVYQNPYALPIGFLVDEGIMDVSLDETNLFELQNSIWASMAGRAEGKLFAPASIAGMDIVNLVEEESPSGIRYIKEDRNKEASITFFVEALSDDPLYAYFPAPRLRQVDLFLGEEPLGIYFTTWRYDIIELGSFTAGEQIALKMKLNADEVFIDAQLFYHQDMGIFEEYYRELSESPFNISRYTDSYFDGEITNPGAKRFVLFTIPYEDDWKIRVNGTPVSAVKVFDTLMAVEVSEGTHSITLRYVSGNLYLGVAVTAFSCIILLTLHIVSRKKICYDEKRRQLVPTNAPNKPTQ